MKKNKKIILLLALFSLFICFYFIQSTYAKYVTKTNGNVNAKIARWNILVNDTDIKNNTALENDLTPVYLESEHIAENVIAPTSKGYIDLVIDCSNVDVSFTYNIKISQNETLNDFVPTGYQIDEEDITDLDGSTEINNDILYTDEKRIQKIRVYLEWVDDDRQTMNNKEDTDVTNQNDNVTLNVEISFIQKAK